MKKVFVKNNRKILFIVLFVANFFNMSCSNNYGIPGGENCEFDEATSLTSCFYPLNDFYHIGHTDYAQNNLPSRVEKNQSTLGWTALASSIDSKYKQMNREKYKLIRTDYIDNETLVKILKSPMNELYFDLNSITKLTKNSGAIRIKILKTNSILGYNFYYMEKQTVMHEYEISCSSNNKLKLINEIWWNGAWFRGIGYTWKDKELNVKRSLPEISNAKDQKWIEEYSSLLCDVITNKNQIKAATWRKNDAKRKIKLEKEKRKARLKEEKRRAKIQQEKERKAKKAKDDRRKRDLDKASQTCLDLGFKKGTNKHKNCIIELL
tara:strand:+ start:155 stop:1120 length:966 start_codon:yes stop_codon:yes gene_type:complete